MSDSKSDFSSDLVQALWESDQASALTNQAARRIEALEQTLEALVDAFSVDGDFNVYTGDKPLVELLLDAREALPQYQQEKEKAQALGFVVRDDKELGGYCLISPNEGEIIHALATERLAWAYAINEMPNYA